MRVLVCGGRDFTGSVDCLSMIPISILIHGGARGADINADLWAKTRGIHRARVDAIWDFYDKGAGFRRNSAMLLLQPEYCVAFPGGTGTAMMVKLCRDIGITVWEPYAGT